MSLFISRFCYTWENKQNSILFVEIFQKSLKLTHNVVVIWNEQRANHWSSTSANFQWRLRRWQAQTSRRTHSSGGHRSRCGRLPIQSVLIWLHSTWTCRQSCQSKSLDFLWKLSAKRKFHEIFNVPFVRSSKVTNGIGNHEWPLESHCNPEGRSPEGLQWRFRGHKWLPINHWSLLRTLQIPLF